jgi:hypothetical protein
MLQTYFMLGEGQTAYRTLVEIADQMQRRERSNKVKALWNKSADAEELRRLRVRLKEVFDRFMVRVMIILLVSLHSTRYLHCFCTGCCTHKNTCCAVEAS